jgi:hypothetical protein
VQPPNFAVPPGLTLQYGGQSSQISIVNGQYSSTLAHNYVISATTSGEFTIPAIRVQVGGQTLSSTPLKLKVVKGQNPTGQGAEGTMQRAWVKLVVPKNGVYVGEALPVEIWLYFQQARDLHLPALEAEGFTVNRILQPTQNQTMVGGQPYNLLIFRSSVAAVKAGTLNLGPAQCGLSLLIAGAPRRRSPFDIFNEPLFGGGGWEEHRVTLTSNTQTVQVLPLPTQNVPTNFNGAVGSYALDVRASPTNVAAGDPITLKIKISGRGTLETLTLPLAEGPNFKVYPSTNYVSSADQLALEGVKSFEFVVTPQSPDVKALPPITFSFFDPAQKSYRTLQGPDIPLVVRPSLVATPMPYLSGVSSTEHSSTPPPQDIVNIKARLGLVESLRPPLIRQPWFLAAQAVPVLIWLTVTVRRHSLERLSRNPRLRRQREVARLIATGLRDLRRRAEANQDEEFFATAFRLLQEQLGERLNLPASAITEAVVEERLPHWGVPLETLGLLHEVFQHCNQARYAPVRTNDNVLTLLPKVEAAIEALRVMRPKP